MVWIRSPSTHMKMCLRSLKMERKSESLVVTRWIKIAPGVMPSSRFTINSQERERWSTPSSISSTSRAQRGRRRQGPRERDSNRPTTSTRVWPTWVSSSKNWHTTAWTRKAISSHTETRCWLTSFRSHSRATAKPLWLPPSPPLTTTTRKAWALWGSPKEHQWFRLNQRKTFQPKKDTTNSCSCKLRDWSNSCKTQRTRQDPTVIQLVLST